MSSVRSRQSANSHVPQGKRGWVLAYHRFPVLLICLLLAVLVPSESYQGSSRTDLVVGEVVGSQGFRLAAWEIQALSQKASDWIQQPGAELTLQGQHDLVVGYFDAISRSEDLAAQIERIYAGVETPGPGVSTDPAAAASAFQTELNALRDEQARRRPAVEHILEQQTAVILEEAGLTTLGRVWPPVRFQFTESPSVLILSPRDKIIYQLGVYLDPTLPLTDTERIEDQVAQRLDLSTLVEGTGGFSAYPTMIIEYPVMEWVLSTVAHEWVHTYLEFHPLGWHYFDNGDTRTLNETTASIIGDEIGQQVLARFYPERLPAATWPSPRFSSPESPTKPEFEYGAFLRETRLAVDQMLVEGQVTEAEAYMEAQRQVLVSKGYTIRKLNQAFFAFHGSYAVGTSATDPIGGKLRALRKRSDSLADFVRAVAGITTVAQLDAALGIPSPKA